MNHPAVYTKHALRADAKPHAGRTSILKALAYFDIFYYPLTRDEISTLFRQHKIKLEDNRLAHLLIAAELNGTICSGATSGNGQKYALLKGNSSVFGGLFVCTTIRKKELAFMFLVLLLSQKISLRP